jgi:hypothetical protein
MSVAGLKKQFYKASQVRERRLRRGEPMLSGVGSRARPWLGNRTHRTDMAALARVPAGWGTIEDRRGSARWPRTWGLQSAREGCTEPLGGGEVP